MEQYPSINFPDDNYAYNFGIYLSCDPESRYIRAYDEDTRYIQFKDCPSCFGGCTDDAPKKMESKEDKDKDKEEKSKDKEVTVVASHPHSDKATFYPTRSNFSIAPFSNPNGTNNNTIIIILIAFIVVVLLLNNNRNDNVRYVVIPSGMSYKGANLYMP